MLGPEEEGKISHVTEIELSERSSGRKCVEELEGGGCSANAETGEKCKKSATFIQIFKEKIGLNKPKKGKKGKKGKGKKKKKK
jgi:hypothetical protein|tara:strand:+ start:206 stop:454 length:249 start_codon:yes stop_codon:yes gene_type:complete